MKRFIYICSPCRGDYEKNITKAQGYCREAVEVFPDVVPIAPHVYFTQFLNDSIPHERAAGMELGIDLLTMCDELWVYGLDISEGMAQEIKYAEAAGIPVKNAAEVFAAEKKPDQPLGSIKLTVPAATEANNQETHTIAIAGELILELALLIRRNKGSDIELEPLGGGANGMG